MALKITLKPGEKVMIAGAVITNAGSTTHLLIENSVPILRKQDIMKEEDSDSPARRIYYAVQLMYLDQANLSSYHALYWKFVRLFLSAVPSALPRVDRISDRILAGRYYQALKLARNLIRYEQNILSGTEAGR